MKGFGGIAFALLCLSLAQASWVNDEIRRTIDLSAHVVRVVTEITVSGGSGQYEVAFPLSMEHQLAYLYAHTGGKDPSAKKKATAEEEDKLDLALSRKPDRDGLALWTVDLGSSQKKLSVYAVLVEALEALPSEITQYESQFMVYNDTLYAASPYTTTTQLTTVKLASRTVEDVWPQPNKQSGKTLKFGPFQDVPGFAQGDVGDLRVHSLNNSPFPKVLDCVREIEVSSWGNIAVEEVYSMEHGGAKLKGGFSRLDYMMISQRGSTSQGPDFRELIAILPPETTDIYYRDQIGNISTSEVSVDKDGAVELLIEPRFPMLGGWKTQWYMGYNLPTEAGLSYDGSRYKLEMEFSVPFPTVWVKELTVKVILPEGAKDIKADIPFEVDEESRSSRLTYLDSAVIGGGRPIVVLRKKNVVSEHDQLFTVTYSFNQTLLLQEPFMLAGFWFCFYLISMVAVRLNFRFATPSEKQKTS